jgi:hypothetical protein
MKIGQAFLGYIAPPNRIKLRHSGRQRVPNKSIKQVRGWLIVDIFSLQGDPGIYMKKFPS